MASDKAAGDPWDGYPEELKEMLLSLHRGDSRHTHDEAIEFLIAQLEYAKHLGAERGLRCLSWVNEFYMNCFDPEVDRDAWVDCSSSALRLVHESLRLLSSLSPECVREFSRDEVPERGELEVVCLHQDLKAFGCVAAGFAGRDMEFSAKLDTALKDNELNVRFLADMLKAVNYDIPGSGKSHEDFYPSSRLWTEILAYLAHAAPSMGREEEVAEVLKRYISYLEGALQWGAPVLDHIAGAKIALGSLEGNRGDAGGEWPPF